MSYTNYAKSVIDKHSLKDLMKQHELTICVADEEVVNLNHFRMDPDWAEIGLDGAQEEFLDNQKGYGSRGLRDKIMQSRNYFYLEFANGVRQLWIRKEVNFILVAANSL